MKRPAVRMLLTLALLAAPATRVLATILTFETQPAAASNSPMPQDYGDGVSAASMPAAEGARENLYLEGNGWTPNVTVAYATERAGEFPHYTLTTEWPGACWLWSPSFRTGLPISSDAGAMPSGFEYRVTFTPAPGSNRGVVLNSFVLDDRAGYFDAVAHQVQWRVARGTAAGAVLASGSATFANGENVVVQTGLTGTEPDNEPVVLVIKRIAGTEDDLALDDIDFDEMGFSTASYNIGSLGAAADGVNAPGVVLNQPGAVAAGGDHSSHYAGGSNTTVPFLEELNPPSDSPFTIEFWARPEAWDNDDAPVFNRVSDGDRSGWVFFQRGEAEGWNFRMYDGVGSDVGWDLTGGPYTMNTWNHVVAVWNGSEPELFVNGQSVDTTNADGKSGNFLASATATFSVGAYDNGGTPFTGQLDEVAFYRTALTGAQILKHFQTALGVGAGTYSPLVRSDGAVLYLQQNPPTLDIALTGGEPTLTFTGKLSQSATLGTWTDLPVFSPYTVPAVGRPENNFFRVRR